MGVVIVFAVVRPMINSRASLLVWSNSIHCFILKLLPDTCFEPQMVHTKPKFSVMMRVNSDWLVMPYNMHYDEGTHFMIYRSPRLQASPSLVCVPWLAPLPSCVLTRQLDICAARQNIRQRNM